MASNPNNPVRPWRSALYVPGSRPRALEKARSVAADAIIFDLEDAVAPEEKPAARARLSEALERGGYGARAKLVRINGLGAEWGREDLAAFADSSADAILLPKIDGPEDVDEAAASAPRASLWAMMETPKAALNAASIAAHPRIDGLVMGTNDLARDLGCRPRPDRAPLMASLQICLLAARGEGLVCLDGAYNALGDAEGLRVECAQGRDMGFDGKTLIHPDQIAVANEVFAPSEEEIDLARRQIAAFDDAAAAGRGVAVLDGRIVENLHADGARATLAKAAAIAEMEEAA